MFRKNNFSTIRNNTISANFPKNREKEKKKMLIDFYSKSYTPYNEINNDLNNYTECLREILYEKKPLNTFCQWFTSLIDDLEMNNMNIVDYLNNLYFLKNDEDLSNQFFNYCFKFFNNKKYCNNPNFLKYCETAECVYNFNKLNSICFITPEIGFCQNQNKIGFIIDELSQGLNELGQDIIIISPYYHCYRLESMLYNKARKISQISIQLDVNYNFDIYFREINGIKYYFIYHSYLFQRPHPNLSGVETIREISCFSKVSLQLLSTLNLIPDIILTNDPYTGFTAAYAKGNSFYNTFNNTIFIHICNCVEMENQGRIYLPLKEGTYEHIHLLPNEIVSDPYDSRLVNPTSCAIRMSDLLATLSRSFKYNLSNNFGIFNVCNLIKGKDIFFITSGISKEERLEILMNGGDKEDAKRMIQQKYFGYKVYNPKIPLYSFIGKLNEQSGSLLLLDIIEKLIRDTNKNINFLIISTDCCDVSDPYYHICLKKLYYLKKNFPFCIYAEPNRIFDDNIYLVFKGSDFGLIPFLYDNWVNLHYKYFAAGTPVIAYDIGHLKDGVKEFNYQYLTGNGFLFDHFNSSEFYLAIKRSLELYDNKTLLDKCKKNCEESVVEIDDVCIDLCRELYGLKNKIFFNPKIVYDDYFSNLNTEKNCNNRNRNKNKSYYKNNNRYSTKNSKKNKNKCSKVIYDSNHFPPDYSDFGKNVKRASSCRNNIRRNKNMCYYSNNEDLYTISYKLDFPRAKRVQITGSYDNWTSLKDLKFNKNTKKWEVDIYLSKGKYLYKFLVDGKYWKINPLDHYQKEYNGVVNNVLYIY